MLLTAISNLYFPSLANKHLKKQKGFEREVTFTSG